MRGSGAAYEETTRLEAEMIQQDLPTSVRAVRVSSFLHFFF